MPTGKLETFMKVLYGMLRNKPQKGSPVISIMAKMINDRRDFLTEEIGTCDVNEVFKMCWNFGQLTPNLNPKSEAELTKDCI